MLLTSLAMAATIELRGETWVQRPYAHPDALRPLELEDGVWRLDGGWVVVSTPNERRYFRIEPGWTVVVEALKFSGDGAAALTLQRDVQRLADSGASARKLRKYVTKRGGDDVAVELGLGIVAFGLTYAAAQQMFDDPGWYRATRAELGWDDDIALVPTFWQFGWAYGRQAGGVKAHGAVAAVDRVVERTDAAGRDAAVHGVMSWALQAADTRAQFDALPEALARWEAAGAHPGAVEVYRGLVAEKLAVRPGAPAPVFEAAGLDGEGVSSASFAGRVTAIDFWGTWCGPCIEAIPKLKELRAAHPDVLFVALAKQEPGEEAAWRATVARHDWTDGFVHLVTTSDTIAAAFTVGSYPHYVVIGADGAIVTAGVTSVEGLAEVLGAAGGYGPGP